MFSPPRFRKSDRATLGVEVELQLVDRTSMALRSAIASVLADLPAGLRDSVKPEFMQCYVEINSKTCQTVSEVGDDLTGVLRAVERAAALHGVRLFWAATHPFSRWQDQQITPNERYYRLANLLQETVTRPVTFGLHVHVGVESGDKAVRVCDRLQKHLPVLLALSANSPFWHGRMTGHHAYRIEMLEGLPTGGLPPRLRTWDDYVNLVGLLRQAGVIESEKDLWWDVRPSPGHGTVEVRICDMPGDLSGVLGLTALIQCLVQSISREIDAGVAEPDCQPLLVRYDRWRAYRFGMDAELVDPTTLEVQPARKAVERLVGRLRGIAQELDCAGHLDTILDMAARPTGSARQIALFEQTGNLAAVVRRLVEESALGPIVEPEAWCTETLVTLAGCVGVGDRPFQANALPG